MHCNYVAILSNSNQSCLFDALLAKTTVTSNLLTIRHIRWQALSFCPDFQHKILMEENRTGGSCCFSLQGRASGDTYRSSAGHLELFLFVQQPTRCVYFEFGVQKARKADCGMRSCRSCTSLSCRQNNTFSYPQLSQQDVCTSRGPAGRDAHFQACLESVYFLLLRVHQP